MIFPIDMCEVRVNIRGVMVFEKLMGSRESFMCLKKGSCLEDLLQILDEQTQGGFSNELVAEDGSFVPGVRLFLNGKDVRFLKEEEQLLKDGDNILFLPLLAGG